MLEIQALLQTNPGTSTYTEPSFKIWALVGSTVTNQPVW